MSADQTLAQHQGHEIELERIAILSGKWIISLRPMKNSLLRPNELDRFALRRRNEILLRQDVG